MGSIRILVVDDEPAYHSIVKALLARFEVAVDGVRDAPAAFHALRMQRYDLILMDIEMAGISGYRGTAHIRSATDWTRHVPIIAFTASRPETGERHFIERGFDGWLHKPFHAADLIGLLNGRIEADHSVVAGSPTDNELSSLLGVKEARAMLERFHTSLEEATVAIDAGADPKPFGHSIGGMAGMLGMPALSAAWLVLEDGRTAAWPTVRALTVEAIGEMRLRMDRLSSAL